jgi:hypothetical protein
MTFAKGCRNHKATNQGSCARCHRQAGVWTIVCLKAPHVGSYWDDLRGWVSSAGELLRGQVLHDWFRAGLIRQGDRAEQVFSRLEMAVLDSNGRCERCAVQVAA